MKLSHNSEKKTVIITGATSGIGKEAALLFALNGWRLILVNRDKNRSHETKLTIEKKHPNTTVHLYYADFSDLEQVKKAAHEIGHNHKSINVLINNVGLIDKQCNTLSNGLEPHFSVNYLASVLFTKSVKSLLQRGSRVIMVTSVVYKYGKLNDDKKSTSWFQNYSNSKLAINLFVNHVASEWNNEGININLIHPGIVGTTIFFKREWPRKWIAPFASLFMKSAKKSAREYFYLATSSEVGNEFGKYFTNNKIKQQSSKATDKEVQNALNKWTSNFLKHNHLL